MIRTQRPQLVAMLLMILLSACGARGGSSQPTPDRNVLATDEMVKSGYPDAFTTVQSLRPQWLRLHGRTSMRSPTQVKVYLDGALMGGPDQLKAIMVHSISNIHYLDGLQASQRWGLDHEAGAIVVSTRRN
jgi:hypothetical protein